MNNTLQRLLLFFIAVPGLIAVIIFLPQYHHLAAVAAIVLFAAGGGRELGGILKAKGLPAHPRLSTLLGGLVPTLAYLSLIFPEAEVEVLSLGIALLLLAVLAPFALVQKEGIGDALPAAMGLAFVLLYPGLLSAFIVLIAAKPLHSTEALLGFALMTFGNDSLAWLFGVSFGKKRNIVAVSPNKSLAGFLGGLAGSIGAAFLSRAIFPVAFPASAGKLLLLALLVGASVIFGDLFESALKRSAGVKDSGSVIPGRGGILDSLDSLLFAAPVYYGLAVLLGLFQ